MSAVTDTVDSQAARAVLASPASSMTQVMRAVATLEKEPLERTARIGISSSVTVDLLGTYLRRHGLLAGTGIEVVAGNFDDPVGDVELFRQAGVEHMVLLPFFDTLLPSLEAQLPGLPSTAKSRGPGAWVNTHRA